MKSMNASIACMLTAVVTALAPLQRLSSQTVPRGSLDYMVGAGKRSAFSGDAWYYLPNRQTFSRLTGTLRIGGPGRVRPVLLAGMSFDVRGDEVALCGLAPNGTCRRGFPATNGPFAAAGVEGALTTRLSVTAAAGVGRNDVSMPFVALRSSVRLTKHVSAGGEFRHMRWRDAARRSVWYQPIGFGIRVH